MCVWNEWRNIKLYGVVPSCITFASNVYFNMYMASTKLKSCLSLCRQVIEWALFNIEMHVRNRSVVSLAYSAVCVHSNSISFMRTLKMKDIMYPGMIGKSIDLELDARRGRMPKMRSIFIGHPSNNFLARIEYNFTFEATTLVSRHSCDARHGN